MNSKKARQLRKDAKSFSEKMNAPQVRDKIYEHLKKSTKGIQLKSPKS